MTKRERIIRRARLAQSRGRAGEAVRLWMLAGEVRTMKFTDAPQD